MRFNLKPEKVKVIHTSFITLFLMSYFGIYYGLLIIPFYLLHSIEFDFKNKKLRKADKLIGEHFLSIILILYLLLILQFLNPINAITQSYRITLGKEKISELDVRGVQELSEEIKERNIHPTFIREYIKQNIVEYKTDYENYGIVDYWETPYEVIEKKGSDCEGYSILTKAITNYLDKDEDYKNRFKVKEIITEIKYEPGHSYTEINGYENGRVYSKKLGIFMLFYKYVNELPLIRKFIFFIGSFLIVFRKRFLESSYFT